MFEYKVIPAPRTGQRRGSNRGPAGRFANAMEQIINAEAALGWEFQRAETLGAEERQGVMRKRVENFHSVLVFRRPLETETEAAETLRDEPPLAAPVEDPAPEEVSSEVEPEPMALSEEPADNAEADQDEGEPAVEPEKPKKSKKTK